MHLPLGICFVERRRPPASVGGIYRIGFYNPVIWLWSKGDNQEARCWPCISNRVLESSLGAGRSRPIDLGSTKIVGQRGRHGRFSGRARTVARAKQVRIMQGRADKGRKPMAKGTVYVAKRTPDVGISDTRPGGWDEAWFEAQGKQWRT